MATMTLSRPSVSSPLADSSNVSRSAAQRIPSRRNPVFQSSRALRPFPSISTSIQSSSNANQKAVKLIEPPKNFKHTFMLNLTQAEFSRQE